MGRWIETRLGLALQHIPRAGQSSTVPASATQSCLPQRYFKDLNKSAQRGERQSDSPALAMCTTGYQISTGHPDIKGVPDINEVPGIIGVSKYQQSTRYYGSIQMSTGYQISVRCPDKLPRITGISWAYTETQIGALGWYNPQKALGH